MCEHLTTRQRRCDNADTSDEHEPNVDCACATKASRKDCERQHPPRRDAATEPIEIAKWSPRAQKKQVFSVCRALTRADATDPAEHAIAKPSAAGTPPLRMPPAIHMKSTVPMLNITYLSCRSDALRRWVQLGRRRRRFNATRMQLGTHTGTRRTRIIELKTCATRPRCTAERAWMHAQSMHASLRSCFSPVRCAILSCRLHCDSGKRVESTGGAWDHSPTTVGCHMSGMRRFGRIWSSAGHVMPKSAESMSTSVEHLDDVGQACLEHLG